MTLDQYINSINAKYKLGNATEHTFRGLLEQLLESIVPEIRATNEPKRQQCGAPDYILTKKEIPVGFIEAKDIGDKDLDGAKKTGNKEQFDRYKNSLNNLIFTDYLDFHLYKDGIFVTKIAIAAIQFPSSGGVPNGRGGAIVALPENFATFTNLIKDFCLTVSQTIKSPQKLALMMAGKARLLSDVIEQSLTSDEDNHEDSTLKDQMNAFKEILIHDITPKGFADVYAQTIAYGMFAARLHDPTLPTFSRQEAAELIPKSNPFLRKLFGYIAGPDLDDRIKWIVDSLIEIFLACNVAEILKNYGKSTKMEDPIIHFYETFLSEYDPKLRKARGVWYTPHPVVGFQIRAIDDILKTEFDLPQGIADNSKIKIKVSVQGKQVEQEVHRVQLLDPATGTGTYIAEVIKHIHKKFKGQQGLWSNYVENHLLPRLIGFELLMASYAMAHLQIDLLLTETGYKPSPLTPEGGIRTQQRLKVYLTNSLEESHPDTGTLFANWLSSEANEANFIKRDAPVMIVMGNPPYASSSTNKGKWIESLTADYKKGLKEKSYNSLSDDYVKFIRFGQHFIDKNGSGILAYISNNSFIDGITHRQMRKHLLESFDKIYILDLHGNAKKKEVCPDGSADQNVFDIMQGVSINIFVKTGIKKKNELGQVFNLDLQGKRDFKYDFLNENSIKSLNWNKLEYFEPNYFFAKKDFSEAETYEKGFKIDDLYTQNNAGLVTSRDHFIIQNSKLKVEQIIKDFANLDVELARVKYELGQDSRDWGIINAQKDLLKNNLSSDNIKSIMYRPFDKKYLFYTAKSKGFLSYPRNEILKHIKKDNFAIISTRLLSSESYQHIFISNSLIDKCTMSNRGKETNYVFPLYLYPETNGQLTTDLNEERIPNLNPEIVNRIAKGLGLSFVPEKTTPPVGHPSKGGEFAPIDILDYIYAVLHSTTYREKYKEFLKIDFPKIPYPSPLTPKGGTKEVQEKFWKLVALGAQIREIHLLESEIVEEYITEFNIDGDCVVDKPKFVNSPPLEGCPTGGVDISPPLEGCPTGGVAPNPTDGEVTTSNEKEIFINKIKIKQNPILDLPYNEALKQRAKELRRAENLSEVLFWMQVTKNGFHKIDFDRQRIIGNYIVDFYVKKLGLVIEIDGSSHDNKQEYDAKRQQYLESLGLRVYRIQVVDIMKRMKIVLKDLENYIIEQYAEEPPRPSGTPQEGNLPPRPSGTPQEGNLPPRPLGTPQEGNFGNVYINETQYFANVPLTAWSFYIGGYQPAQKWLKDRKGRKLEFDDILHYQKIIVALTETDRLMKAIDLIAIE